MIDFSKDPIELFEGFLKEAFAKKVVEPNAMSLATVDANGVPSVRIVYHKGMVRGGLSFYTNYQGAKALDIEVNPTVCVNFFWGELAQQIRVTGKAVKLTRAESEAYFATRARLSQLGAWASHQSSEIPAYDYFKMKIDEYDKSFEGQAVPCPSNWGGYHIVPDEIEFWFGHQGRLHERYVFTRDGGAGGGWKTAMLSP
jgi:pyridoxamine-phosphate oxidase